MARKKRYIRKRSSKKATGRSKRRRVTGRGFSAIKGMQCRMSCSRKLNPRRRNPVGDQAKRAFEIITFNRYSLRVEPDGFLMANGSNLGLGQESKWRAKLKKAGYQKFGNKWYPPKPSINPGSAKFRDVKIGQWFDFIKDESPTYTSFWKRCKKTSTRTYVDEDGQSHRIGSINAMTYHLSNSAPGKKRNPSIVHAIRAGDRVTIVDRFGKKRTGRAVMRSSHGGWVLNMGGRHGTPGIADNNNIVGVSPRK